ncbi:hypothetical protein B0H17DRAFT_1093233 [Mycena rosella]|uniref:Uncharacterized protein n=1 Tax=Mycena rosella TaxID=1033263 RepID=A0AAD7CTZ7_MYCRO|nr:hypothetical protein B0H17DRAFT_1093233 [Mycena rosella]
MSLGLEIVQTQIEHITGIWDLVEAMGYPGANIFIPVEERILLHRTKPLPVPIDDPTSKRLFRLTMEFLGKGSTLDEDLNSALLVPCLEEMQPGPGGRFRNELLRVSDQLSNLVGSPPTQSPGKRTAPNVYLDHALNKTIGNLVHSATVHHGHIRHSVNHVMPLAESTIGVGSRLLAGIDSEISRTRDILRYMKTDSRTLSDLLGRSPTRGEQFTAYLRFLEEERDIFRGLFESALIIQHNLKELYTYCIWYTDDLTTQNQHPPPRETPVTLKDVTRSIRNLLNRVEIVQMAGVGSNVSGTKARRL